MGSKRLIILSASESRSTNPQPLPAIERYQGVFFRVVRKYVREGKLKNAGIIVVSERYGVLQADEEVPYHTPFQGKLSLSKEMLEEINQKNLAKLKSIFNKTRYSEIIVVCGQEFRELIKGFEELTDARIVLCKGRGLGPKAQNLKQWILKKR